MKTTLDPTFDRRTGVGASEVAAILGLDPRKTPFALWLEKTGQAPPFEGNEWTRMGHRLEGVIADTYAERHDVALETCETRRSATHPHVFATPDRRVVGANRLVECKAVFNPRLFADFGEDGSNDYPEHFAAQAMVQGAVFGADDVHLAALLGGELRVYRVPRDERREQRLLDAIEAWWDRHVERGEHPALDGSDAASEWLERTFPRHERPILDATGASVEILREVIAAHAERKRAEERFEVAKQEAQLVIADCEGLRADGVGRVSWKRVNGRLRTDWEAVVKEAGVDDRLVAKHSHSVPGSRRFLVTPEKHS